MRTFFPFLSFNDYVNFATEGSNSIAGLIVYGMFAYVALRVFHAAKEIAMILVGSNFTGFVIFIIILTVGLYYAKSTKTIRVLKRLSTAIGIPFILYLYQYLGFTDFIKQPIVWIFQGIAAMGGPGIGNLIFVLTIWLFAVGLTVVLVVLSLVLNAYIVFYGIPTIQGVVLSICGKDIDFFGRKIMRTKRILRI